MPLAGMYRVSGGAGAGQPSFPSGSLEGLGRAAHDYRGEAVFRTQNESSSREEREGSWGTNGRGFSRLKVRQEEKDEDGRS